MKSNASCRNEMKRCRFGVQNGVFSFVFQNFNPCPDVGATPLRFLADSEKTATRSAAGVFFGYLMGKTLRNFWKKI